MAVTYEPIASTTLGGSGVITFSSIGSTFTDLRLVIVSTGNMGNIGLRFNSDSGTNYSSTSMRGNGSTASSTRANSQNYAYITNLGTNITAPALTTTDIFSYAGSTFKTMLSQTAADLNGSGETNAFVNLWRSTSAINELSITCNSGVFASGTTATLYGIKEA
jgi:hypothetical protein